MQDSLFENCDQVATYLQSSLITISIIRFQKLTRQLTAELFFLFFGFPTNQPTMCQSIQYVYKFCGCLGELYEQRCPKPTPTCKLLLANPQHLKLTCYCEQHSSQTFKTIHQDQRDTARFNKEYNKILAREEKERLHQPSERQKQILTEHRESLRQEQKGRAEFRHREREMEAYGQRFGKRAMRRKYPVARERYEEQKSREAQERPTSKRAGIKSDRRCVAM